MRTKAIQIWGTGSGVGKSVITAGLCRIFLQDGYKVAPFKAQNMALNSFATKEGGEIGRAQAEQAEAAKIAPSVDMNPILLKPSSNTKAQVILQGKPIDNMNALEYTRRKQQLFKKVLDSYARLCRQYELIVIEGAGSPAEINLKQDDIVNLKIAEFAQAEVILVGDIDKGGVFASFIGTLELLDKAERQRIKGFIINKFRGDKRLLRSGLRFLEKKTGKKVLGVIPYIHDIKIGQEDSLPSEDKKQKQGLVNILVVKLPHMSNFTDFDILENEPIVTLRYIENQEDLNGADAIIIPGTKSTILDLRYLRKSGLADKILWITRHRPSTCLIGICGGFQMLGKVICDPYRIESSEQQIAGLGLFDLSTTIAKRKQLYQIKAKDLLSGKRVRGYEIHHGRTIKFSSVNPAFKIQKRNDRDVCLSDGAMSKDAKAWGTYIHGVFDSRDFRQMFLRRLLRFKGLGWRRFNCVDFRKDEEFNKLAKIIRKNTDIKYLYRLLKKEKK